MNVYIGADHRGCEFKNKIAALLNAQGHDVNDMGVYDESTSCDYPEIAYKVASEVAKSQDSRGVLVCMSGIGQAIAANKVRGAYAALCYNEEAAALSRRHNNANILVLGSKFVVPDELEMILKTWMTTKFEGGRHERRVNQIKDLENKMNG